MPRPVQAIKQLVTPEVSAKLRKDWLLLSSNIPRVDTVEKYHILKKAFNKWRDYLDDLFSQVRHDVQSRMREGSRADKAWAQHYLDNTPMWMFSSEVRLPQLDNIPKAESLEALRARLLATPGLSDNFIESYLLRNPPPTQEQLDQAALGKWQKEAQKDMVRARAKAPAVWKWLDEYYKWTRNTGLQGGGGDGLELNFRQTETLVVQGFHVQLIDFDVSKNPEETSRQLNAGLAHYRQQAQKVYPWLLQHQLPLVIYAEDNNVSGGSAWYAGDHIGVSWWTLHGRPDEWAHHMAHEMGHYIYQKVLKTEQQTFWSQAVKGDFGPLDLKEVLSKMRDDEKIWEFEHRIKQTDPVLYLQAEAIHYLPAYKDFEYLGLWGIQKLLDRGITEISVPKHPITGYAGKNSEEAFCETLGLLVGYGPRAVSDEVKKWFWQLLPGVRMASNKEVPSAQRVAAAYYDNPKFGPNIPLMVRPDATVKYRVKSNRDGVILAVYYGKQSIGGLSALVTSYPEQKSCPQDVLALLEKYPQVEDRSRARWQPYADQEAWTNTRALTVQKAFITDDSKQGMGIGKAMYQAVMAEWFDKVGPFLFMPHQCGGAGSTSQAAKRVWESLKKIYPSSGNVLAVLQRPVLNPAMHTARVKVAFDVERARFQQLLRSGQTVQAMMENGQKGEHYRFTCPYCEGVTQCRCMSRVHEQTGRTEGVAICHTCLAELTERYSK